MVTRHAAAGFLLLSVLRVQGQDDRRAVRVVPDLAPLSQEQQHSLGFDPAESAGLFVGIRHFYDSEGKKRAIDVPYAVDDAVDLAHLFTFELRLVSPRKVTLSLCGEPQKEPSRRYLAELEEAGARRTDARFTTIVEQIGRVKTAAGEKGSLILTFATHGYTASGVFRLLGQDSVLTELEITGVPVERITDAASAAGAPRQIVLIDACRERVNPARSLGGDTGAALPARFEQALREARGMAILCATTPGGFSYDDADKQNGVFTAAVLAGLRGAAGHDPRGFITPATLAAFVDQEVRSWVERNRPADTAISRGISYSVEELRSGRMPLAAKPLALRLEADRTNRVLAVLRSTSSEFLTKELVREIAWALEQPDTGGLEPLLGRLEKLETLGSAFAELFAHWWEEGGRARFAPIGLEIRTRSGKTEFEDQDVFAVAVGAAVETYRTVIGFDSAGQATLLFPNPQHPDARTPATYDRAILLRAAPPHGTGRYVAIATRAPLRIQGVTESAVVTRFCPLPEGLETPVALERGTPPYRWQPLARFLETLAPLDGMSAEIRITTRNRPEGRN